MRAKLIRKIDAPEGLSYYFDTYEYECIDCGNTYYKHQCNDRISPYCGVCYHKHEAEKSKKRTAERKARLIDNTLCKVREEVEGLQTYLLFSGDTKKVELESVLEIIDRVKQEVK
jgi:hypothetical protein